MSRLVRIAALCIILVLAAASGAYIWRNPETATLNASARAGVPGQFLALSHGTTHYEVAGPDTGRIVLLVHGFSVPYYIWDSTFATLASTGHRVIRYDLYGRGWSDRPHVAYNGALYDAQISELLDSLHVTQPVDIVGLSFGGFVTAHYVAGHSKRVRTLTLVDPISAGVGVPAWLGTPVLGNWVWQVFFVPGMADNQASDFLHPEHFPLWAQLYRPQMKYLGFGRSLLSSALMTSHTNFDSLYGSVAKTGVPVLLAWGKQDQTIKVAMSDVVRRNVPTAEFFPVDSSGHLPHIEQATQFRARLSQFFAAHAVAP